MKHRLVFHSLMLLAVFLALTSTALASSTWYVDGINGSNNNNCKSAQHACKTIGHAISLALSGDTIKVAAATYTENLIIDISLRIIGSGAATTIIDGGFKGIVVIIAQPTIRITLSKFTIQNGVAPSGGGILNEGTLAINQSTLTGNTASERCRDNCGGAGGGIRNDGTLTVNNSTISGNTARASCEQFCDAFGGGIWNTRALTINNSTISGNRAFSFCGANCGGAGGGIENDGTLTVNNSTISGNAGATNISAGGILAPVNGSATTTLQNSIVANNKGEDCVGTITSRGYNLSSDGTCNFNNIGDLQNTDPKLGTLGYYGGPTQTIPLLLGSPAIDVGNPSGCTDGNGHLLKTDQRGKPRPDKEDTGGCDMGAFERQKD